MTQIEIIYDNNIIIGFNMKGHAGYNQGGPDILCASLSTASQMTINGILDWIGVDVEEAVKEANQIDGILHFEISVSYTSITTNQLFKSFEIYVEQLEEQYKENVKLERRQRDDN